jgi:hypothetical protein
MTVSSCHIDGAADDAALRSGRDSAEDRLTGSTFAGLNVAMTLVWIFVARQITREHRRKTI